jgi:MoaA/NifB/PqqE/SkfB family radical SAM enzyme
MLSIIDVSLSNECNYRCSYCIANAYRRIKERGSPDNPLATVKSGSQIHPDVLINWIKGHFDPKDTIVSFVGGEPLLYPALKYLVMSLAGFRKVIVSNMEIFPIWHKEIMPRLFEHKVWLKMSFHPSMTSWEDFSRRIEGVPKNRGLVNYVLTPQDLIAGIWEEYAENVKNSGYKWNINPFKGMHDGEFWDKSRKEYKGKIKWEVESRPFRIFGVEPNGNAMQCYRHKLGNIYSGGDICLKPDIPKCVFECLDKEKEISSCDCYSAIIKLLGGEDGSD